MAEEERLNGVLSPCGHDHKAMRAHERRQWLRLCACTAATDLLFITMHSSETLFSPTTRTRDLALGPSRFHWRSQNTGARLTANAMAAGKV